MKLKILLAVCIILIAQACKKNQKDLVAENDTYAGTAPTPCNTCGLTKSIRVFPADTMVSGTLTLCPDITYILAGKMYVQHGGRIVIPAGTVIKGRKQAGHIPAALVITKGARIEANGSASCPVIFTSESDSSGGNPQPGDWGGLVILGKAKTVAPTKPATAEGLGAAQNGIDLSYGGTFDHDNSGFLRYVRIQYAGARLSAGVQLRSLSLYGLGAGTELDHIETFKGLGQGFRFYGGNVNAKYLLAVSNGDEQFDCKQGYRGRLLYLVNIQQSTNKPGSSIEYDNSVDEFGGFWLKAAWIRK